MDEGMPVKSATRASLLPIQRKMVVQLAATACWAWLRILPEAKPGKPSTSWLSCCWPVVGATSGQGVEHVVD